MNEIICPHCGKAFQIDEAGYADIAKQIRDAEFDQEIQARLQLAEQDKASALKLAQQEADNELQKSNAEKDAAIQELRGKIESSQVEKELAVQNALSEVEKDRDQLANQLAQAKEDQATATKLIESAHAQKVQEVAASKDTEIQALKAQLAAQDVEQKLALQNALADVEKQRDTLAHELAQAKDHQAAAIKLAAADHAKELQGLQAQLKEQHVAQELAVTQAVTVVERQRDEFKTSLEQTKLQKQLAEQSLKDKYDTQLKEREEMIERLRDLKAKLSTKMVGETLEQHCEIEFNRLRPTAFPTAYFEKDNDASSGSKGDYIFRDTDENNTPIVSIMFEMKNENDSTATKKKNEDFFKELDKDRNQKQCEYAVLVSLLEPENELYNSGIVDVSHRYPKMYVIRPQFFIPMISLLRNAAMNALEYKNELALMKAQNVDITNFENDLEKFKEAFGKNYDLASRKFQAAIDEIDKSINHLQKTKDALLSTDRNLRLANNKAQDVTVKTHPKKPHNGHQIRRTQTI